MVQLETLYRLSSNCKAYAITMNRLEDAGIKVIRTWAFNDATDCDEIHFQCWSDGTPTINTGENGLQRLDSVVSSAEAHGVQLILPFGTVLLRSTLCSFNVLLTFRPVNNWEDYGGMDVYVENLGGSNHSSFYTEPAIQDAYKNYITTIVERYIDSSAIYAWELGNEPRCSGCDTSVITEWATTYSEFVKSLDPDHYVLLGDEGFFNQPDNPSYPYQGGEGTPVFSLFFF